MTCDRSSARWHLLIAPSSTVLRDSLVSVACSPMSSPSQMRYRAEINLAATGLETLSLLEVFPGVTSSLSRQHASEIRGGRRAKFVEATRNDGIERLAQPLVVGRHR